MILLAEVTRALAADYFVNADRSQSGAFHTVQVGIDAAAAGIGHERTNIFIAAG
ncbi:MAG: hypothetical protein H0X73_01055 [Chthoniobacterales bacterium]|nr:hypothetical protein [Chthoniobacterales bacterium]